MRIVKIIVMVVLAVVIKITALGCSVLERTAPESQLLLQILRSSKRFVRVLDKVTHDCDCCEYTGESRFYVSEDGRLKVKLCPDCAKSLNLTSKSEDK